MLYDVSVTRTSTASLTIRVEADSAEEAEEKAVEQAHDEDYTGCVVEYDFDANGAVEVEAENSPNHANETLPEGDDVADETAGDHPEVLSHESDTKCALCFAVMPDDLIQVIDEGWAPSFWDGEEDCSGPVCPDCVEKYLDINHPSGELVLKDLRGEYVSEWASGKEYRCPCKVNMHTRRIEILELFDATEEGELVREYVIISGKEYTTASFRSRDEFIREDRADMFFWG